MGAGLEGRFAGKTLARDRQGSRFRRVARGVDPVPGRAENGLRGIKPVVTGKKMAGPTRLGGRGPGEPGSDK